MTDPYQAAEQAAIDAYGTCGSGEEAAKLTAALTAYRHTLTAADLLHHPPVQILEEHAETAARYLAEQADLAGFPRYSGDGWRRLLQSRIDVNVAHKKAAVLTAGDEEAARDLGYARRLLNTFIDAANRDE